MNLVHFKFLFILINLWYIHCAVLQDLVSTIFKDYDPGLRPVINPLTATDVKLRLGIIQLLDVEEVAQTIELVSFIELSWTDEFLRWNSSDFGNVTSFLYSHDKVWNPDVILTNTPDLNDGPVLNSASTNVLIYSDGQVVNGFVAVYKATCRNLDMTDFPFDSHRCFLEFCSWSYSENEMNILEGSYAYELPNSMKSVSSPEWDYEITQVEKIVEWECCPNETYPLLRLHIVLKRKPLYYLINLVIPTVITCYISFFGMFSPSSNRGQRVDKEFFGISTLLAVYLLMLTVTNSLPVTSVTIPIMWWFLSIYDLLIAVAILCTSLIMWIDAEGNRGRPLSKWTRKWILEGLGRYLGVDSSFELPTALISEEKFILERNNKDKDDSDVLLSHKIKDNILTRIQTKLIHIDAILTNMYQVQLKEDYKQLVRREWSQLCVVLDRICLIFFIVVSACFTIGLLTR